MCEFSHRNWIFVTKIELARGGADVLMKTQASMLQNHLLERGHTRLEKTNGCQRPRHITAMPAINPNYEGIQEGS
jgi:hypothetical protein